MSSNPPLTFEELELPEKLLKAFDGVGYETPSPIQAQTIPHLLEGHDLLGHAPTGTGKTAAFALPVLARVDMKRRGVQALVLAPTRVMDHMRKGTLVLDELSALELDEADEMLRMGFIDDVEWILEQTPAGGDTEAGKKERAGKNKKTT